MGIFSSPGPQLLILWQLLGLMGKGAGGDLLPAAWPLGASPIACGHQNDAGRRVNTAGSAAGALDFGQPVPRNLQDSENSG